MNVDANLVIENLTQKIASLTRENAILHAQVEILQNQNIEKDEKSNK